MAEVPLRSDILRTWKEIAEYLGMAVRTAQRWEQSGLPVRRPHPGLRASVVADPHEIDAWIHGSHGPAPPAAFDSLGGPTSHITERLAVLSASMKRFVGLCEQIRQSRAELRPEILAVRSNIQKLIDTRGS